MTSVSSLRNAPVSVISCVQELIAASVMVALDKLDRTARKEYRFERDDELRACVALARLTSLLLEELPEVAPLRSRTHPDLSPQERAHWLSILANKRRDRDPVSNS